MKKSIFLAGLALLALASCGKHEVMQNESRAIAFGTYAPKATRAADGSVLTGTNFAANATINVYAWNTGENAFAEGTTAPNFMKNDGGTGNGTVVTLSDTPATKTSSDYSPVKFWPGDEASNNLSFIGFYPSGTSAYTLTWTNAGNVVEGSITVPAASASQVDFMASDVVNDKDYSTSDGGNVPLKFHHLMSQVLVKVQTDSITDAFLNDTESGVTSVTVSALTFTNILDKGKLTTDYAGGTTTHTMTSDGATTQTYTFSPAAALDLKGTSTAAKYIPSGNAAAATGDAFILVPQTLAAGAQKVSVTYKITYDDGTDSGDQTVTKDLTTAAVSEWEQNQKIVYTFVVGLHPITFTADITADWTETTVDPITF